jgi:hypothetical protein
MVVTSTRAVNKTVPPMGLTLESGFELLVRIILGPDPFVHRWGDVVLAPVFLLGALDFRQWLGLQTVSQPSSECLLSTHRISDLHGN